MKFFFISLLLPALSFASELKTDVTQTISGYEFTLYELAYQGDTDYPLANFARSLQKNGLTTTDGNFTFTCEFNQPELGAFETICTGHLVSSVNSSAVASIKENTLTIALTGETAVEFINLLPPSVDTQDIQIKDKFRIVGRDNFVGILVQK